MSRARWSRRQWLRCALGGPVAAMLASRSVAEASAPALAAAWQDASGPRVGVLSPAGSVLKVMASVAVPTRAHGLVQEPAGTVLSVARRPGDWLLRWDTTGLVHRLRLAEPGRVFNGHVLCDAAGVVYTSETDVMSGQGLIGVRDAETLEKWAEWPTHGQDPHAMVWDRRVPDGARLIVANGGIALGAETGRMKLALDRMDSSLVCLEAEAGASHGPSQGRLHGQWRLPDSRLSLRHLAWYGEGERAILGVAMQAQHDEPQARERAPVLALLQSITHGMALHCAEDAGGLRGYGGDIAATSDGFVMGCPRAHRLAAWTPQGRWLSAQRLAEACAVASSTDPDAGLCWSAGASEALHGNAPLTLYPLRLDNHWIVLR